MADRVGTPSWVPEAGHREFEALRTDQFGGRRPGSTQRQLHRAQRPTESVGQCCRVESDVAGILADYHRPERKIKRAVVQWESQGVQRFHSPITIRN